jgi:tRNA threonylcarbamoyl adenosine modification protein YeaZ
MVAPLLLGIDTALGGLSISLCRGEEEIAGARHPVLNDQAAQLIPMIETVLAQGGMHYESLDGIAVTVGPGGFTGVRIGLSAARAIGFAAGKPVHGVTTLALMAMRVPMQTAPFLCALPAGREQVYVQSFGDSLPYPEPVMVPIEEIVSLAGGGTACIVTEQPWKDALPAATLRTLYDSAENAYLACQYIYFHPHKALPPLPLYIRPPDAKPQTPLFQTAD